MKFNRDLDSYFKSDKYFKLAMIILSCDEEALATKLNIPLTKLTKLMKHDYLDLPSKVQKKLDDILKVIGTRAVEFVLVTGGLEQSKKWEQLLKYLASKARYNTRRRKDVIDLFEEYEKDNLCSSTFLALSGLGIDTPSCFPKDMVFDYKRAKLNDKTIAEAISANPYPDTIYKIYQSYVRHFEYFCASMGDNLFKKYPDFEYFDGEIYCNLIELAAVKSDIDESFAKDKAAFSKEVIDFYTEWLKDYNERALAHGIKLKKDIFNLVHGEFTYGRYCNEYSSPLA